MRSHLIRSMIRARLVFMHRSGIPAAAADATSVACRVAIVGMAHQIVLEYGHGFIAAAARVQRDGVDIGVSGFVGIEFDGTGQFVERFVPAA